MLLVVLERADASNNINGGISESLDLRAIIFDESHKIKVHMDMMGWDMFIVVFGMSCAKAWSARPRF
jgi:hypothetical protein